MTQKHQTARIYLRPILILVSMFILNLATCHAADYDKWVLGNATISYDSLSFQLQINPDWDIVAVEQGTYMMLIPIGSCQSTTTHNVCFLDARWDITKDYGAYDPFTEKKTPDLHITIKNVQPALKVVRSSDKKELLLNEIATITVTIDNTGYKKATDLWYVETLPISLEVISGDYMIKKSGTLIWQLPSLIGSTTFTYKVRQFREQTASYDAELTYTYDGETKTVIPNKITMKPGVAENPLEFESTLSNSKPRVGEWFVYTVTLENTDDDEMQIENFRIVFPQEAAIGQIESKAQLLQNTATWQGTLRPEEQVFFKYKARFQQTGDFTIEASANNTFYSDIERRYNTRGNQVIKKAQVSIQSVVPSLSFMFGKNTVAGGEITNIKLTLQNPNTKDALFDIKYKITSPLFASYEDKIEIMGPEYNELVFFKEMIAPSYYQDKSYEVKVDGSCRTQYYQVLEFSKTATLKVTKDPNAMVPDEQTQQTQQGGQQTSSTQSSTAAQPSVANEPSANQAAQPTAQRDQPQNEPQPIEKQGFIAKFFQALGQLIRDIF
ncbi:DUF11 domain-containing protein [Candidatus Woesearchaeota archaeon]|nr:DUF11 domain-containing protein [Candidatus Woesearchaeota archaeon]